MNEPLPVPYGCTDETVSPHAQEMQAVEGWIRIRLAEDAGEPDPSLFTCSDGSSGNEGFDKASRACGATEMRRVFAEGGKYSGRRRKAGLHLWYDIRIGEDVSFTRAGAEFASVPGVEHVQPIYRICLADTNAPIPSESVYTPYRARFSDGASPVNDPQIDKQWHYHNDGSIRGAKAGADINLFEAWEKFNAGRPEVVVAVFDLGVQYDHPDLAPNMWVNRPELDGAPGVDDDGNGYVDDIYGYNFVDGKGDIVPGDHGTHCAGTVAAVNNNGIGVAGVAGGTGNGDGARIMSCQLDPAVADAPCLDAFAYAADNGALITSNSWVLAMDRMPEDVAAAVDYFNRYAGTDENGVQTGLMKGGICMFAAGNYNGYGQQYMGRIWYPAADGRVIGVASMGADYQKAAYSQYGQGVDIMAPGGDTEEGSGCAVYSTVTGSGYGYMCGTSMATPHAAGVAALMVSQYGGEGFTSAELRRIFLSSYRNVGEYQDEAFRNGIGAGLLDASLMDSYGRDPHEAPDGVEEAGVAGIPDGLQFTCTVPADRNGDPAAWLHLRYLRCGADDGWTELKYAFNMPVGSHFSQSLTLTADSEYDLRMSAEDRYGNISAVYQTRVRTLPHINRPPSVRAPFTDVILSGTGASYARRLDVGMYFTDPDIAKYADRLSYAVLADSGQSVVSIGMEGAYLVIEPLGIGAAEIVVRASDTAGEYAEGRFTVYVIHRPFEDVVIRGTGKEGFVTLHLSDHFYEPPGKTFEYKAESSDPHVVTVRLTADHLTLVPQSVGEAEVSYGAATDTGANVRGRFRVTVSEVDTPVTPARPGALSVYPNPVSETLHILLPGTDGDVSVRIYDSAARTAFSGRMTLGSDGSGRLDVASLPPGAYSLVIGSGANRYSATFLKK